MAETIELTRLDADSEKVDLENSTLGPIEPPVLPIEPPGTQEQLDQVPVFSRKQERIFVATLCWCMFLTGWNASTLGPLLPTIQKYYHIDYTIVSMLFVAQCCGTIPGSGAAGYLTDKIGFGGLIAIGAAIQLVTYSVMVAAPPYPVFCVIYMLNGLAGALQVASCNIFVTCMPRNRPTNLGIMHGSFGMGALASPLIATQFAQMRHWSFHYFTSLAFAIINNILVVLVFRWKRQEVLMPETASAPGSSGSTKGKYVQALKLWQVHALALFIFVYVGGEVMIGGWIVTYLLDYRGGGPSSGYASSGFFGGIALGRMALLPINKWIGPDRVIFIYALIAIGFEFTILFVPNLVENAVAGAIVGLVMGPFYPIELNLASRKLPKELLPSAIGWISACGQTGSAIFPFVTGALAQKYGAQVLQPVALVMMAAMIVIWFLALKARVPEHIVAAIQDNPTVPPSTVKRD